jgi:uncharacterized RDD family membrane protein YckC
MLVIAMVVMLAILGGLASILDSAAASALGLLAVVAGFIGIPTAVETLSRGRSLGKLAMGLRVVRDDGGPIRVRHALIRASVAVLEIWILGAWLAILTSLINSKGKRVGDLLAGTYVIRERGVRVIPLQLGMPPGLAGWAAGADIGRLPDDLAMALRQFLQRREQFRPGRREELGADLGAQALRHVAPAPPPGTHPELFITALLFERRNRELARLHREKQLAQAREHTLHALPHGFRR